MDILDIERAEAVSGVAGHVLRRFIREGVLQAERFAGGRYLIKTTDLTSFLIRYRAHEFDGRYKKS
jgi:predicted site-specific integrase-resolvase